MMSSHYGEKQKYENNNIMDLDDKVKNKIDQMVDQISIYESKGINIDRVIYADDSIINQRIFRYYLSIKKTNIEFISLIPGCKFKSNYKDFFTSPKIGLEGLNECINQYIESLANKKDKGIQK